jgi:putative flippase GtrA
MLKAKLTDRATQVRFLRFLVVGGTVCIVQFAVLAVAKEWMRPSVAFSLSWLVSLGTNYVLNRFWALPTDRRDSGRQLFEYLVTAAVCYGINLAGFKLGHDVMGLSVMWAAALAIPPSTLIAFLLLNYRVFRAPAG